VPPHDLASLTTLRVGGRARELTLCETEAQLIDVVTEAGDNLVVLGGGSNVVIADGDLDVCVAAVRTRGITVEIDDCAGAWVTAAAGESWDDLVSRAVTEGWIGIECLAGIPGLVGATPIQNVGAYGQEVSSTIARVRAFDRVTNRVVTIAGPDCGFAYRWSRFKAEPNRHIILDVTFQLRLGTLSEPIRYAELAKSLGIEIDGRAAMIDVSAQVRELRRAKGMLLDPTDHDTWSVGSFFLNPVLPAGVTPPEGAVTFPAPEGGLKVSAAWLIGAAGISRGFGLPESGAAISGKHTLAITNIGTATATDVVELAREVQMRVAERFGITLHPEPRLIGCSLDQ